MRALSSFDQQQLRSVLGTFVTGVTVVTTRDANGKAHGVTANSFSSVSLDPPLVLWSQSLTSSSHPAFCESDCFAVNIMADDQVTISNHFAKPHNDKFSTIAYSDGLGGAPIIEGCAAHIECRKVAAYPGGDHVVFLGRVERISQRSDRRPLAFGGGRYVVTHAHDLGPTTGEPGSPNLADIEAIRLATAALPQICADVGQHTLCLAVWGNRGPTAIRWEPSRQPVSEHLHTGYVMNVLRSATGRAFAGFLPGSTTEAIIEEHFRVAQLETGGQSMTAFRQQFDTHVADAQHHIMARATEQRASPVHRVAVNAFSVPIFDATGRMVLALSLTTPASRLPPDWDGPVPMALSTSASALSRRLGYIGVRSEVQKRP